MSKMDRFVENYLQLGPLYPKNAVHAQRNEEGQMVFSLELVRGARLHLRKALRNWGFRYDNSYTLTSASGDHYQLKILDPAKEEDIQKALIKWIQENPSLIKNYLKR